MDTERPNSLATCDYGASGDDEKPITPLWWIIVWSSWGLTVGVIIFWLDRDLIGAASWICAGIAIGTSAIKLFGPCSARVFGWYRKFTTDPDVRDRIIELTMDGKAETEEFERLLESEANQAILFLPPMFGLLYGTLLGAIVGSLSRLDPTLNVTAFQGAFCGVLLGTLWISIIAAVVLAVIIPQDKTSPFKSRVARRAQLMISPVFVFPAVWHSLKWLCKRRRESAA